MNPVHRPESRANTGLQGLYKKYRMKNVYIKIKYLDATEENSEELCAVKKGIVSSKKDLVH
ncbi:hypothetical protein [Aeromonas enteropelogenes]|uniref:hypothetical protein n=1 Tax=Aeromonas enteropelogenes TaxID=29489 RepID=UPI00069392AA|nr:hypothetical protein [Aeromonas enteropelogenes]UBH56806.1 hypothetical protein LA341_02485 [Aeromonas enteropelogenes]